MAVVNVTDDIHESWHRDLGHAEYRVMITMAGYGRNEDAADALLGGFLERRPETGPVVSQDRGADTISAAFILRADAPDHALRLGRIAWADGGAASGLAPTHVVRVEVEPIDEPDMAALPDGWGKTLTGEPMPNVAAAVRRSREAH